MSWMIERTYEQIVLDHLRVGIRQDLGAYAADRLEIRRRLDEMVYDLTTYILAQQLPTERVTERRREQIETARFATWWDHFKATYRGRWWMRWRRWPVRQLVDAHEIEAVAVVDLTRYWTFPRANIAAPQLGDPLPAMTYAVDRTVPSSPPVTRAAPDRTER